MSNGPNLSRTVAIDVLFSINSAVVFDFMYFRFCPSKAKSMSWRIGKTRQRGFKKSAEELWMGIPTLRQYIDPTMPFATIGNGVQICSVFNFQIAMHRLMTQDESCVNRQCVLQKRKINMRLAAAFCLFMGTSPISFGLLGGSGNTLKLEMTTKLKDKQTLIATVRDLLKVCLFPGPPLFSLQTTFLGLNFMKKG